MLKSLRKTEDSTGTENKNQVSENNGCGNVAKLTVFGYTGKFINKPVISIYYNNILIGDITQNQTKVFEVTTPGMVMFKYKRASANVPMTGEMAVQLDFDRVWGGLIAQKV